VSRNITQTQPRGPKNKVMKWSRRRSWADGSARFTTRRVSSTNRSKLTGATSNAASIAQRVPVEGSGTDSMYRATGRMLRTAANKARARKRRRPAAWDTSGSGIISTPDSRVGKAWSCTFGLRRQDLSLVQGR
jgi:hypothetical protein